TDPWHPAPAICASAGDVYPVPAPCGDSFLLGWLEARRRQRDVGTLPRLLETFVHLGRLGVLLLCAQALREPEERPPVVGVALEIEAVGRFGLPGAAGLEQHRAEVVPRGVEPV